MATLRRPGATSAPARRKAPAELPKLRQRMLPEQRERLILKEATRYFAEYGLNGGTLELARRLGITQPLLYKYFPTKEAMIEKVFDGLFPGHWDPRWENLLDDAMLPLRDRLKMFYKDYAKVVLTYEHVRLFLFSGLSHFTFNSRYYDILTDRIFVRIARALRAELLPKGSKASPKHVGDDELEVVQSLHAAIYHVGFRQWIHMPPLRANIDKLIELKVDLFLEGAGVTMDRLAHAAARKPKQRAPRKR